MTKIKKYTALVLSILITALSLPPCTILADDDTETDTTPPIISVESFTPSGGYADEITVKFKCYDPESYIDSFYCSSSSCADGTDKMYMYVKPIVNTSHDKYVTKTFNSKGEVSMTLKGSNEAGLITYFTFTPDKLNRAITGTRPSTATGKTYQNISSILPTEANCLYWTTYGQPMAVTWDTSTIDNTSTSAQTVTGDFILPQGFIYYDEPVAATLNLQLENNNITSLETLQRDVMHNVPLSTSSFPTTVKATLETGEILSIPVKWTTSSIDTSKPVGSTITVTGDLDLTNFPSLDSISNLKPTCQVHIISPDVTSVEPLGNIYLDAYTNESLQLPTEAAVNLSSNNQIKAPITWDSQDINRDKSMYNIPQTLTGIATLPTGYTDSTVDVSLDVTVIPRQVKSVELLNNIEVPAFTDFNDLGLKESCKVIISNETTNTSEEITCKINWDEACYNNVDTNEHQLIYGTLTLPYGVVNTIDAKPTTTVIVNPVIIEDINSPTEINVEFGTPLENIAIPSKLKVNDIPNIEYLDVEYDTSNYDALSLGTQTFEGTAVNTEDYMDISNLAIPDLKITVSPTEITNLDKTAFSITGLLGDTADLIIPTDSTVLATLNSGITYKLNVNWDTSSYDKLQYNQSLNGSLTLPTGILNTFQFSPKLNIELEPDTSPTGSITVINIKPLEDIKTAEGSELGYLQLPDTVKVTYKDGTVKDVKVHDWDLSDVDPCTEGTYTITTKLEGTDIEVSQDIIIKPVSSAQIAQILPNSPTEIYSNQPYTLPTEVKVILGDGTITNANIVYNQSQINTQIPGVYYITGELVSSNGNPLNLKVIQEVDVVDLEEETPYIVKLNDTPVIKGPLGCSLNDLSFTNIMRARLSNNRWVNVTPSFDLDSFNSTTEELQKFESTVLSGSGYENPLNLKANLYIQLYPTTEIPTIDKALEVARVSVPYDTQYTDISLPSPLVQLSNGKLTHITPPWILDNYLPKKVGIQTFEAVVDNVTFLLEINVLPDKDLVPQLNTVESIENPGKEVISNGNILKYNDLPKEIEVTLKSGSVIKVPVKWDYRTTSINRTQEITGVLELPDGINSEIPLEVKLKVVCNKSSSGSSGSSHSTSQSQSSTSTSQSQSSTSTSQPQPSTNSNTSQSVQTSETTKNPSRTTSPTGNNQTTQTPTDIANNTPFTLPQNSSISSNTYAKSSIIDMTPVANVEYSDVKANHWAYGAIEQLSRLGYIKGTTQGTFNPSTELTVADTFTFLDRILVSKNKLKMLNTRDSVNALIKDKTNWSYYNVASILSKIPLATAKDVLDFNNLYTQKLTREQVAVILYGVLTTCDIKAGNLTTQYSDMTEIEYTTPVSYCTSLGLFKGDSEGNFNPTAYITRAEFTTVMQRLISLL